MGYSGAEGLGQGGTVSWELEAVAAPISASPALAVPSILVWVLAVEGVLFAGAAFTGKIPGVVFTLFRALLTL